MEVELTEASKAWILEHYPQGNVWEYNVGTPLKLHSMGADFVELTYLGIPYLIPPKIDGKPTTSKTRALMQKEYSTMKSIGCKL